MRKRNWLSNTVAALAVTSLLTAAPASAGPIPLSAASMKSAAPSAVIDVRSRRGNGGAAAAGLITGLIIGGLIASSPYRYGGPAYYYGPPDYYPDGYYGPVYRYPGRPGWIEYCFSRYRSFDPVSGTYMGYDGRRHYCR